MSDEIPLRTQQSCTEDEYYKIHVFSYARPATNGGTGSLKQLVLFITKALEDSGQLDIIQKQLDQGMVNVRSVYTDSFRWRKSEGTRLLAQLIMGDFQAEKKVDRLKIEEMKLGENFVFTLPKSNASFMTVEATLMNESRDIIFQARELDLELSTFQGETRPAVENEHEGNQPLEMEA
ncbi:hypothetical protein pdam_00014339 [Pocillopora damicornis]|uniref:Uncharacterized protein n=1 Tax=Pocillopora damicornis TaxID=46731 RepID=A0A3M6TFT1_POCDA|nr:uncharacterized protein LOC113678202 isoform X1 [Pocillopora damicornis]RMX40235.1 hypothetical protein pdam_00014339 [Pocillopora damicornis]